MIGKTIGRYQIIEKIGEGGMGAVYKAEDSTLNRYVALKTISAHLSKSPEARERFIREAQAASTLNHPNVTTVHDLLESDDQHFICMEYVDGQTVREVIEAGPVSIQTVVDIAIQTAEALNAAHQKGILHRDIKSSNIMVSRDGLVKVMDFGLAHLEDRSQLTRSDSTLGTLAYSSPEQLTGGLIDERSEIFSLGVVLYELITSQLPFIAEREGELIHTIISNAPEKITSLRDDISTGLEAVVGQMLQKLPDSRYSTCAELIADLRIIRDELSAGSERSLTAAELRQKRGRRLSALKVTGIILLLTLALSIPLVLIIGGPSLDRRSILVVAFDNRTGNPICEQLSEFTRTNIEESGEFQVKQRVVTQEQIRYSLNLDAALSKILPEHMMQFSESLGAGTVITADIFASSDEVTCSSYVYDVRTKELLGSTMEVSREDASPDTLSYHFSQSIMALLSTHLDPLFGEFADILGSPTSVEAYRLFSEAEIAFLAGNYPQAIQLYYTSAEEDSSFIMPLIRAHEALSNNGKWAIADSLLPEIERRLNEFTKIERLYFNFRKAFNRGNHEETLEAARQFVSVTDRAAVVAGLAALYTRRPEEALGYFERVDLRDPWWERMPIYWYHYLDAFHALGTFRKELREIKAGRDLHPDNWSLIWREFRALAALGRYRTIERRVADFKTPSTLYESYIQASYLYRAGVELRVENDPSLATPLLRQSLSILDAIPSEQSHSLTDDLKVVTLFAAGEISATGTFVRQLLENAPDSLTSLGQLGVVEARLGNQQQARNIRDQIISAEYRYKFGQDLFWLACITAELGDLAEAFDLLKSAVTNGFRVKGGEYYNDLRAYPFLDALRNYQPFQEWMKPVG
ncbi:protein kinase [Candidatus Zixiibacteriota bacterium]